MSEASLAAQRMAVLAMRARPQLTTLVPSANIFDRSERPEIFPCVVIGEGQTVADEAECVIGSEVYLQIHAWTRENGLSNVKQIAGEIRRALFQLSGTQDGFALDFNFADSVFLRDPNGENSHAVVSFRIIAEDLVGIT